MEYSMTQDALAARLQAKEAVRQAGLIATPGGFRPPSFVHRVGRGQSIVKRGGVSHLIDMATAKLIGTAAAAVKPPSPTAPPVNWVTWANWNNNTGNSITSLSTTWTVPSPPAASSGQLLYLFNGLENASGNEILQPVLQWGVSGAGGGNLWSVASWYADSNGHAYSTPSVPVNPGDTLTGIMTEIAVYSDGTRNYNCQFQGIDGTILVAQGMDELTIAEQTLEAYWVTDVSEYPATPSTAMKQIAIATSEGPLVATWTPGTQASPKYGEHTGIAGNGTAAVEIAIFY